MGSEGSPKPNGLSALLAMASGGDNWVKLVTLGLILVTSGGNFFATQGARSASIVETDRAIAQIKDIHTTMQSSYIESVARQKDMYEAIKRIEGRLDKLQK